MPKEFERKNYSKKQINDMILEKFQVCMEPVCYEMGQVMEALQSRIHDLEAASNAMILEMKEWKEKNQKFIQ
jgi:hypothetical protein